MPHHLVGIAEVAGMLGVSRQRVSQLAESYPDFPTPEAELAAGRVWSRTAIETWISNHPDRGREPVERASALAYLTDAARLAVVQAQEQARLLGQAYIGTEHLLLGLLADARSAATRALSDLGVGPDGVRENLLGWTKRGEHTPAGHIPFTPRAKEAIEGALEQAMRLGRKDVAPEHLLLSLIADRGGLAAKALDALGASERAVRDAVLVALARTASLPPAIGEPPARGEGACTCSFCGKTEHQVAKLIAGPGVYICDVCVRLCVEIIGYGG